MNYAIAVLIILLVVFLSNCKTSGDTGEVSSGDERFKIWVVDTLRSIEVDDGENYKNIVVVDDDSLDLKCSRVYDSIFIVNDQYIDDRNIKLLTKYLQISDDDILNRLDSFYLSFTYSISYFPSAIKSIDYEMLEEFRDIILENDSRRISVSLTRGDVKRVTIER